MPHPTPGFTSNQRKARKRLARLRTENPKSLAGVKPTTHGNFRRADRVAILRAARAAQIKRKTAAKKPKAAPFNPLEPLAGKDFETEAKAAERLQYGDQDRALKSALGARAQTEANTASYYEDYRQALREGSANVQEANRQNISRQEERATGATDQENARLQARDAQVSEQAKLLGRAPVSTEEGHQAVASARAAAESGLGALRDRSASDSKYFEGRNANAALAKAQAMGREAGQTGKLREQGQALAKEKGDFRVAQRTKARESEREWAAVQQEFGLKKKDVALKNKASAADRSIERQKLATQKIVAGIYAAADRSKAKAQVEVARLQLRKGVITKSQYKTIRNIYEGLPSGGSKSKTAGGAPKLQNWEKDRVSDAVHSLTKHKARSNEKAKWIAKLQDVGVSARLARIAWAQYTKYNKGPKRPDTAGNPNVSK